MSTTSIPTPSRLDKARDRLENAVSKIESALDERADSPNADPGIEKVLAETRSENQELKEIDTEVSRRLDGLIKRLKVVLEE